MRREVRAAIYGGLVAGGLDITYAFIGYGLLGVTPFRILQSVASGWMGKAAYEGGAATAALGLVSHLFIACVAAALYVIASRRWPVLTRRPLLAGGLYGLAIFFAMNYGAVPLSAATVSGPKGIFYPLGLLVHIFLVGVPIALFARRAGRAL
jgi:uncharacterized membrane protein YagU involved in acid resistance